MGVFIQVMLHGGGCGGMSGNEICVTAALDRLLHCFLSYLVADWEFLTSGALFDSSGSYIIDRGWFYALRK